MTNPYAPAPLMTSSNELVSGGGADGTIDHVVAMCLQRVLPSADWSIAAHPDAPSAQEFDLAELISLAAASAGVRPGLPTTADALQRYCHTRRTIITVAQALTLKGAVLFGQNSCGLSLGRRTRCIVYSSRTGIVVDEGTRTWSQAARIPGARGYR